MGKSSGKKKKANSASGEGATKVDPDDAVQFLFQSGTTLRFLSTANVSQSPEPVLFSSGLSQESSRT